MALCFQQRDKAVIEECLGPVGASPTGNIDLIGDADDGDVHSTLSSCMVSCPVLTTEHMRSISFLFANQTVAKVSCMSDSSMEFLTLLYVRMM
jgi:hypothetical protein